MGILRPLHHDRARIAGAAVASLALLAAVGGGYVLAMQHHQTRQAVVDAQGADVMPFNLNRTTHVFTKNATGGIEMVIVKDAADAEQIDAIRTHLQLEADKFSRGDYSDPARIHGMDMPGMKQLEDGASRVQVTYAPLGDGARIIYASDDPSLVDALHNWFDRQVGDHGTHATAG